MTQLRDRSDRVARLPLSPLAHARWCSPRCAVRVHPSAERMAIDSAVEAGVPLLVVNLIPLPLYVRTLVLWGRRARRSRTRRTSTRCAPTAHRAAELGVQTELLRVRTRHAVQALLEVLQRARRRAARVRPRLGRVGRLRFRATARRLRRSADCLVWIAPDG